MILQPRTAEEIAAILRVANREGTPVRPRGGGTGWWSSTLPPEDGILLRMTRMNEVLAIDEDVMTVRVEAGVTFAGLEEALAAKGYRIMIFPESGRTATVGGHIQTWGTSPHTSSVFEDQATQIVGLKVVLPTGEIVPTGTGAVTTAAGDFNRRFFPADLTGLFLGSEGAFGVVAEATLKIHRQPEALLTRVAGFPDLPGGDRRAPRISGGAAGRGDLHPRRAASRTPGDAPGHDPPAQGIVSRGESSSSWFFERRATRRMCNGTWPRPVH